MSVVPPDASQRTGLRAAWVIAMAGALLAVWLRWHFVTHAQVFQPLDNPAARADAVEYYRYAWNIAHHGIFSSALPGATTYVPDSFRDPGYPLYLAAWMVAFPDYDTWYSAVLLAQAVMGGVTVACIVLAMRDALRPWLLGIAATFLAAWPHGVSIAAYVLSENLTALLWAMALLAISGAAKRPSVLRSTSAGLLFAGAGLTNAVLIPVAAPICAALAWKGAINRRTCAIVVLAAFTPLAAWAFRNAMLSTASSSTYRAEQNFVQGSWPIYHDAYRLMGTGNPEATRALDAIQAEIEILHAHPGEGLTTIGSRISEHPWRYIGWYVSKPSVLWGWDIRIGQGDIYVYQTRNSPYTTQPAFKAMEATAYLLNPLIGVLALAGTVIVLIRRNAPPVAIVAAATIGWVTCVYAVLQSEPRYAIPFRGGEVALAFIALAYAITFLRRRHLRTTRKVSS